MIYFELNEPVIGKHYYWTQKRSKLGMVSSFDPHSMCAKFERITEKIGCTSCTNWTTSFKVRGFQTKTHLFQKHFIFLNYFNSRLFLHPTCNIQSHILKFQPFFTSFAIFHAFNDLFWAKWPYNWKALQLNSEKCSDLVVSSFDPHSMCAKFERIMEKTGCTSCTNWTIFFESTRVSDENSSVTKTFIFLSLFQLKTFFASNMQHSKPHTEISTLSDFIWYFSCI